MCAIQKQPFMTIKKRLLSLLLLTTTTFTAANVMAQEESPKIKLGGAVRFNYNYSDWKDANKSQAGAFGFDVFRLNAKGAYKGILLDAEYRLYPESSGGGMLKHGWFGYQFNDNHEVQLGLTGVRFGILPFTSNNYFFNINYYAGLEDDADMGVKYLFQNSHWQLALAYFKNSDLTDFGDKSEITPDRYAYDIAGKNKEVNQGNVRIAYTWGDRLQQEAGISAMVGGIYNIETEKTGSRYALAAHYRLKYRNWDVKAQAVTYAMRPKNEDGTDDRVTVAAYGAPYEIAAKADTYSASLAYTLPVNKGILDEVVFYNDFSMMHKRKKEFHDSYQNVTGCMLAMGPVYTYIDYALGKNHSWLGPNWNTAFAEGEASDKWHARFNINIGYYF